MSTDAPPQQEKQEQEIPAFEDLRKMIDDNLRYLNSEEINKINDLLIDPLDQTLQIVLHAMNRKQKEMRDRRGWMPY